MFDQIKVKLINPLRDAGPGELKVGMRWREHVRSGARRVGWGCPGYDECGEGPRLFWQMSYSWPCIPSTSWDTQPVAISVTPPTPLTPNRNYIRLHVWDSGAVHNLPANIKHLSYRNYVEVDSVETGCVICKSKSCLSLKILFVVPKLKCPIMCTTQLKSESAQIP